MTYFIFIAADRGNWTAEGCKVGTVDEETGLITCECTHLTNFAILVVSLHASFQLISTTQQSQQLLCTIII